MRTRRSCFGPVLGFVALVGATASGGSDLEVLIEAGAPLPGGGTLALSAIENPVTVAKDGRIAFFSKVDGSPRNQGIFSFGSDGLAVVAMGCGGPGGSGVPGAGCGDPTPLGGTFSGFFSGIYFVPATNAWGDVLFLADIDGGSAPRALFLWDRRDDVIRSIAAIGQLAPSGASFGSIGTGVVNDHGVVVFLAREGTSTKTHVYEYQDGFLRRIFAIGEQAPMGGEYDLIANDVLGFVDQTEIPAGPLPALDASGRVVIRAQLKVGPDFLRGLILRDGDDVQWLVNQNDPVPGGGIFADFQAPLFNESGELAFFANVGMPDGFDAQGWFFGRPNAIVRALSLNEVLNDGAKCNALVSSRGPMSPLDDSGNLAMWAEVLLPSGLYEERILIRSRSGNVTTAVRKGTALASGGSVGAFQSLPSLDEQGDLAVSFETPGASSVNAHYLAHAVLPWVDLGFGKSGSNGVPELQGLGDPKVGLSSGLRLQSAAANALCLLIVGDSRLDQSWFGGTLVPAPTIAVVPFVTNGLGAAEFVTPVSPALTSDLLLQAWIADAGASLGVSASNALIAHTQ